MQFLQRSTCIFQLVDFISDWKMVARYWTSLRDSGQDWTGIEQESKKASARFILSLASSLSYLGAIKNPLRLFQEVINYQIWFSRNMSSHQSTTGSRIIKFTYIMFERSILVKT